MRQLKNYPTFTPEELAGRTFLLETVRRQMRVRSDRQLGERLGFNSSFVCRVKAGRLGFTDELILAIHDATDMPIAHIKRAAAGDFSFVMPEAA